MCNMDVLNKIEQLIIAGDGKEVNEFLMSQLLNLGDQTVITDVGTIKNLSKDTCSLHFIPSDRIQIGIDEVIFPARLV